MIKFFLGNPVSKENSSVCSICLHQGLCNRQNGKAVSKILKACKNADNKNVSLRITFGCDDFSRATKKLK